MATVNWTALFDKLSAFFYSSLLSLLLSLAFHVHGLQPMGPFVPQGEATAWTPRHCFEGAGNWDCDFHAAQQRHHSQGCLQRVLVPGWVCGSPAATQPQG